MKNRKSLRLKGYDYSKPGYYFVTIRSGNKNYPFCNIVDGEVILNEIGMIIEKQWKWLFDKYDHVLIDEYVIMPDHFHAILRIVSGNAGDGLDRPLRCQKRRPLSQLIGAFKTTSSKRIHLAGYKDFKWYRSFNDRILREHELNIKREYIGLNPKRYNNDK